MNYLMRFCFTDAFLNGLFYFLCENNEQGKKIVKNMKNVTKSTHFSNKKIKIGKRKIHNLYKICTFIKNS